MDSLFFAVPVLGVLGLLFALFQGQKILKEDSGNERMKEIAKAIAEGAEAFLFAEYRILLFFVCSLFLCIGFGTKSWLSAVAFIFGSLFHGLGTMPKNFFWSFSLSFFRSFLFIMTCSSVVTCLLYLTRSTLASYLGFFALIMLQSSLVIVFPQINSELFLFLILAGSLLGGYQAFQHRDL